MSTFGLRASDDLIFAPYYSFNARVVLAAILAYPERDPSLKQLQAQTGLDKKAIGQATHELEATAEKPHENADGDILYPQKQAARFNRPEHPWERNPDNPRFNRSTRLAAIQEKYDDAARSNSKTRIELPGAILDKLPRGKGIKNAALLRLVALAYCADQLRRGAIHKEDATLAYELGANTRQIKHARTALRDCGVVLVVKGRPNVYTMPNGTPGKPENPDQLSEGTTKHLYEIKFGTTEVAWPFDVRATKRELDEIRRLATRLGYDATDEILFADKTVTKDGPCRAEAIIASLTKALAFIDKLHEAGDELDAQGLPTTEEEVVEYALQLTKEECPANPVVASPKPQDGPVSTTRRPGLLPSTLEALSTPSSNPAPDVAGASEETPTTEDGGGSSSSASSEEGKPGQSNPHPRRQHGREWFSVFYFTDDATHAYIVSYRDALEAKHGQAEAANFLREACYGRGPRPKGRDVADWLRSRVPGLDPAQPEEDTSFLDGLLGEN